MNIAQWREARVVQRQTITEPDGRVFVEVEILDVADAMIEALHDRCATAEAERDRLREMLASVRSSANWELRGMLEAAEAERDAALARVAVINDLAQKELRAIGTEPEGGLHWESIARRNFADAIVLAIMEATDG